MIILDLDQKFLNFPLILLDQMLDRSLKILIESLNLIKVRFNNRLLGFPSLLKLLFDLADKFDISFRVFMGSIVALKTHKEVLLALLS